MIFEIALLFFIFFRNVNTRCLPGEARYDAFCYYRVEALGLTWQEAEDWCVERGAHLASVSENYPENNLFYMLIRRDLSLRYWLGNKRGQYGDFPDTWIDGRNYGDPWYNWANLERHQYNGIWQDYWNKGDCAVFVPVGGDVLTTATTASFWGDMPCDTRDDKVLGFCKYVDKTVAECNWNGRWKDPLAADEDKECYCDPYYKGENCSIPTCNGFVGNEGCSNHGTCVAAQTCECDIDWQGSRDCSTETNCFGFPKNHFAVCSGNGKCVKQDTCVCDEGYEQYWDCRIKNTTFDYENVCKKENLNTTHDWLYFNYSCWWLKPEGADGRNYSSSDPDDRLLWNENEEFCRSMHPNAHIISLHSIDEKEFVRQYRKHADTDLWTGGNDMLSEDRYMWNDGSDWDFEFWRYDPPQSSGTADEPNNWYGDWIGGEQLIEMYSDGRWNDIGSFERCFPTCRLRLHWDTAKPYGNEWDNVLFDPTSPFRTSEKAYCDLWNVDCPDIISTCYGFRYDYEEACGGHKERCYSYDRCNCTGLDTTSKACANIDCSSSVLGDDGWIDDEISACYKFVDLDNMTWYEAENHCKSLHPSAHLAAIHSQAVNDFLLDNSKGKHLWIGLNDILNENEWLWTDGTNYDFERWMAYEPDNFLNEQHYTKLDSWRGDWTDTTQIGNVWTSFACKINMYYRDGLPKTNPWDNVFYYDNDLPDFSHYPEKLYCNLTIDPLQEHPCPSFMLNCHGKIFADDNVCGGANQGYCESWNLCNCINDYYGTECENYDCFGLHFNDSGVCGGKEKNRCIAPDTCECNYFGWVGPECLDVMQCNEINWNETGVCNGRGNCIGEDLCNCTEHGWEGNDCEIKMTCNGVEWDNYTYVCNGKGDCTSKGCQCTEYGYSGENCDQKLTCNNTLFDSDDVCNKRGNCLESGKCECSSWKFQGDFCEFKATCNNIKFDDETVCNGRGNCTEDATCVCNYGYEGVYCDLKSYIPTDDDDSDDDNGDSSFFVVPTWFYPVGGALALLVVLMIFVGFVVLVLFFITAIKGRKFEKRNDLELNEMGDTYSE